MPFNREKPVEEPNPNQNNKPDNPPEKQEFTLGRKPKEYPKVFEMKIYK